jgi:hypothetical protein
MYEEALFIPDVNCGYIQSAWHWEEALECKICVEWIKNYALALWFNDAGLFIKKTFATDGELLGGCRHTSLSGVRETCVILQKFILIDL